VVVVAGIYVVFWPLSDSIARHDVGPITGPHRAAALQTARDAARGRLLAFGAGLFAVGALVYTGRNFTLSRRTFQLTEQGQVTDRYTKAIEQLGSNELGVRIGGIYALEPIARDSAKDHPTVMEVLTAFIRDLTRADLTRVDLRRAILYGADLTGAALIIAWDLTGADLTNAADLTGPDLTGAHLTGAHLEGADLIDATLDGATLEGADLDGAWWLEGARVPDGWTADSGSGQLKPAGGLSEVIIHYL
jgi:hypothetical protein